MTSPFDEAALYQPFLDERSILKKLPSLTTKSCVISSNSLLQDEKGNNIEHQRVGDIDNTTQREIFNYSPTTMVNIRKISNFGDGIIEEYFDEIGDIEKNIHQVDKTQKNVEEHDKSVQRISWMSFGGLTDKNVTLGKIIPTSNFIERGQLNQKHKSIFFTLLVLVVSIGFILTFMQQNEDGQQGDDIVFEKNKTLMKTYNHIYHKIVNHEILFP